MISKKEMEEIFDLICDEAGLDYAYSYGVCCGTCMNDFLVTEHGLDSFGIWLKWYEDGMNKTEFEDHDSFYIAHDLTPSQMDVVLSLLEQNFTVEYDGDNSKCIKISSKEV